MLTPEERQKLLDAGYSASKISAYERARGVAPEKPASGFGAAIKDIPSDFMETGERIIGAVKDGVTNANEVRERVATGETTPLAGTGQTIGGGLRAGARAVGEAFTGLGKLFVSPSTEKAVAEKVVGVAESISKTDAAQNLAKWYTSLDEEQRRNIDAATGGVEGLATIFGLSPLTKGAGAVTRTGAGIVADAAPIAGKAAKLPALGASEVQGALTGTSGETIREAFSAARQGGASLDKFTDALRKRTTPEELVGRLRESVETINAEKSARFGEMLSQIGGEAVDTTSILPSVVYDLKQIGVTVGKGGQLDFSQSKFRTVPQAASKLQAMYDEIQRLGATKTVQEIDTSRQALGALMLTGDDASARTANLAITKALDRVRTAGKKVDGYGEALAQFGDDAQFLDELNRALSSGDKTTIDTAYRKLATVLKTNNEQRRNLLMELDEATGGYILAEVAGQQLSEELPRGIFRQIAAGMAGASVLTGGISAGILPALVFASPRVTGEVLRALGIATGKIDKLMEAFGKVRKDIGHIPDVVIPPTEK